jgi:hypothetical protein
MTRSAGGALLWQPEMDRVRNVVAKLARGHVAYEMYPPSEEPEEVVVTPLCLLSAEQRDAFEQGESGGARLWPEIGSRAFMRACGIPPDPHEVDGWMVIQPGRYRYVVDVDSRLSVRVVLSEYLACFVRWEE